MPPPDSEEKPLAGNRDQKPEDPGVSLKDVQPEDLKDTARTLELHAQAVEVGVVTDSEADRLLVVAAAEHAIAKGTTNPCGLFITVLKKLRKYITHADEEQARKRIKDHFYPAPAHVPASRPTRPVMSADQLAVRAAKEAAVLGGYRGDPFYLLRREDPTWTRDRWNAACLHTRTGEASLT